MAGERIVFTDEITPDHHVRVIVSGAVDEDLLASLDDYVKRQRTRLKRQAILETPVHGAMATEYTNDEAGRQAAERDRRRQDDAEQAELDRLTSETPDDTP